MQLSLETAQYVVHKRITARTIGFEHSRKKACAKQLVRVLILRSSSSAVSVWFSAFCKKCWVARILMKVSSVLFDPSSLCVFSPPLLLQKLMPDTR